MKDVPMRSGARAATVLVAIGLMVGVVVTMRSQPRADEGAVTAGPVPAVTQIEPLPPIDSPSDTPAAPEPPSPPPKSQPSEAAAADAPATAAPVDIKPVRVRIPGIDVDADVIDLSVGADGRLEVPTDFAQTGWYTGRSAPGEFGPSIVVGHVDSKAGPAVFFRLRDLEVGDVVHIDRSDGLVAYFRVSERILVDKNEFPTERVYGSTDAPELRLVTCGGEFNQAAGSYVGNVIVFAEHLGNFPLPTSAV